MIHDKLLIAFVDESFMFLTFQLAHIPPYLSHLSLTSHALISHRASSICHLFCSLPLPHLSCLSLVSLFFVSFLFFCCRFKCIYKEGEKERKGKRRRNREGRKIKRRKKREERKRKTGEKRRKGETERERKRKEKDEDEDEHEAEGVSLMFRINYLLNTVTSLHLFLS